MEYDKKAAWQRYSGLTTSELVELQRSNRLPITDAAMVEEMLAFRGVSKTARENLKNPLVTGVAAPAGVTSMSNETTYKDVAPRPLLVTLISVFALWGFISNVLSLFETKTPLSFLYFLAWGVLSICLAYGLWTLKPWARGFMIFYASLNIFMAWTLILLLYMQPDEGWKLSFTELARASMSGKQFAGAFTTKIVFIKASILTVINGLLLAYFFRPSIRRLFL